MYMLRISVFSSIYCIGDFLDIKWFYLFLSIGKYGGLKEKKVLGLKIIFYKVYIENDWDFIFFIL